MYDKDKRDEMLKNGFWPLRSDEQGNQKEEYLATARGNLTYRPDLWEKFGLTEGFDVKGTPPYDILVFKPKQ